MQRHLPTKFMVAAMAIVASAALVPAHASDVPRAQLPAYDAFGFGAWSGGTLFVVARRGSRHKDDPGRATLFAPDTGSAPAAPSNVARDTNTLPYDERGFAGGITPLGCLLYFAAVQVPHGPWLELRRVRTTVPFGPRVPCPTNSDPVPLGGDVVFCPYGPLVALPSGRLLQTFYGFDAGGVPRIRVLSSTDDGMTWDHQVVVDRSRVYRPTEAAIAFVGGKTDRTSRLVMVARTSWHGTGMLMQYLSTDGGEHWKNQGIIPITRSSSDVIPWITPLSGGRLALVWADRESLSIKVSIEPAGSVIAGPRSWKAPREIYHSSLRTKVPAERNLTDFGYPSIVRTGPKDSDVFVSFYDSTLMLTADRNAPSGTTIYAVPLKRGSGAPIAFGAVL